MATGIVTSRDSLVYGFSKSKISHRINEMISSYNADVERCGKLLKERQEQHIISSSDKKAIETFLMSVRNNDATKISWSAKLTSNFCKADYC